MPMDGFVDLFEEDLGLDKLNPDEEIINTPPANDDIFSNDDVVKPENESIIDSLLKAKGIENSIVTILDEDENEKEINFYELSKEEQLEILNAAEPVESETDLDVEEVDLINYLRTNNLSVEQFLAGYREQILAEAEGTTAVSYDIDSYDDQELFLLDLKNKFDLTDEELETELEKELANMDLFTKKVTKLRDEYKLLEDQYKADEQAAFEAQRNQEYDEFVNTMVDVATNIEDFHGVYLEDSEKNEVLSYLAVLDDSGTSQFSKDLQDPQKLYEAAWYLRYGAEAFKALEDAYEAEIAKLKKTDKPKVVRRDSTKPIQSIHDLN